MSRVLCRDCGMSEDARAMQPCAHCGVPLCPACSARSSLCAQCLEDEGMTERIL